MESLYLLNLVNPLYHVYSIARKHHEVLLLSLSLNYGKISTEKCMAFCPCHERGSHANPNTGNIGILWLGDFNPAYDITDPRYGQVDPLDDVNGPPLPQYFSTIALISWLNYEYGIDNLYGHRELNPEEYPTACPGDYAMPYVDFLKNLAP